jgi:hypothetical protein
MCSGPVYGVRGSPPVPSHPWGGDVHDRGAAGPTFEALRADELAVGEIYDSWRCATCDSVIALARRAPEGDPFDLPDAEIRITCSDCEASRPYHMHQRRVRRYPWPASDAPA